MRTDLPVTRQKVSALPDVAAVPRQPEDEFVLLACDGVYDVMTSHAAIK
jgi:serine/threonine protein phosphatase PrpC